METYSLMELCKQSGGKNVICHLLSPIITISLAKVEEKRSYMVIVDNGVRYCLTGNEGVYDEEAHKKLVPMQPGDVPTTYADSEALQRDYGFTPKITLREGLRKFAEWYKEYYK